MWNYRQAIGMMTRLQENSRRDIAMTLPHTARFFNVPKLSHNRVVHNIQKLLEIKELFMTLVQIMMLGIMLIHTLLVDGRK